MIGSMRLAALLTNRSSCGPSFLFRKEVMRNDVYRCVTHSIVAEFERGVRPWLKLGNAESGRTTRPLRSNLIPYQGINARTQLGECVQMEIAQLSE